MSSHQAHHSPSATIKAFSDLSIRIADEENVSKAIADVADQANALIGHRLFTVMAFDSESRQVRRIFSSQPTVYPPGGIKSKGDSPWANQVLDQGRPLIGVNSDDIRRHFSDHELIAKLGLASVLNMPVRVAGRTIGTMNLLHEAGFYESSHLELGRVLASLLSAPLLLHPSFGQASIN